ncbi:MAG: DUF4058 family protein [Saprospiraceae bacterium]
MESPFAGMDPFLEGAKWPDVHHKLMTVISELITPLISPKYLASVETYTVEDDAAQTELGIIYPDVAVLQRLKEPMVEYATTRPQKPKITPASVTIPKQSTITVRIPRLEIRDVEHNKLITVIEILSPVNKRNPGIKPYRKKRRQLYQAGIHLLEIDLLRRGTRPFKHELIGTSDYCVNLVKGGGETQVWSFDVMDLLPVLPIPLLPEDEAIPLGLREALQLVYQRSYYRNSIDYTQTPPPPTFSEEVSDWIRSQLEMAKLI